MLNTRTPNTIDINLNEPSCSNFCENAVDVEPYQSTADNIAKTRVENIVEMLSKTTLEFKSNLHSKLNFSRKDVQVIQSAVCKQITSKISAALNDIILPKIKEEDDTLMLGKVLQLCSNPFDNFESEYMYFKHLKENNLYAESTDFVINDEATAVLRAGVPYIEEVKLTGTLLPFSFIVKKFFELPNVLKMTLENMKELELSNVEIKNFINGKVWKDKVKKYPNQILIPYFVYFDDFEINDPLNPHSCGIGAALINFPTIPSEFLSMLENIFPVLFVKSEYKKYGNNATFDRLIDQINALQREGLDIVTPEGTFKVHFILGLVIGDNLGLHTILGYIRNFSTSNFPCRTCKMHKSLTKSSVIEDPTLLRDLDNYELDVSTDNISLTGIWENSAFNRVDEYHVVQNFYCDIMHDLFEGVCKYTLCDVISYYTEDISLFSLATLNNRKQFFDYGEVESGNLSSLITKEKKLKLNMTARETWMFSSLLPLIIGDLIPQGCEIWSMFCKLLELMDVCLESTFTHRNISLLETLV